MMIPFSIILTILVAGLVARWVVAAWPGGDGHELAAQSEVRRLSEEQSFMVRLLSRGDGPSASQLPPPPSEPQSESP